jgi:formate hydrogenlyase subunit 6/NADH:ubiquinone oxidoreductase subunit I
MSGMLKSVFRSLLGRPATRRYPYERRAPIEGTRGTLKNDIDACIFCSLCAKRCPSQALEVSKTPKSWTFDPYKCVLCGYCVEVCPKKCLAMRPRDVDLKA